MTDTIKYILFYLVVFLSNIIQCITGFAGTVLAMPFSLMLVGYPVAKPVLNILGILASIGVVAFNFHHIRWKEFLKIICIMFPGMAFGILLIRYASISKQYLSILLAAIVLLFTIIGCYSNFLKKEKEEKPNKVWNALLYFVLLFSGIVHGMFVCGGPLLIIYASTKLKERDAFRATLSMSWIVLNSLILLSDIQSGYFSKDVLPQMLLVTGISALILVCSLLIGNLIAKKMSRNLFMIVTYVLMAISALSLILNAFGVI